MTDLLRIDPTVPVHRQPQFVIRPGDHTRDLQLSVGVRHEWFTYHNGCECKRCDELIVATSGRRSYCGRHRKKEDQNETRQSTAE